MPDAFPLLRPLDVRPMEREGEAFFLLRDPLELSDQVLMAPQAFGPLLMLLDGKTPAAELAAEAQRRYGVSVAQPVIDQMLQALDGAFLLQNERSRVAQAKALENYQKAPFRPPASAGAAYAHQPQELKKQMEGYLSAGGAEQGPVASRSRGLVSPHIDYARGGAVYAQVWAQAAQAVRRAKLVVILGTDHFGGGQDLFTLTRQNYATPYGVLPTLQEAVTALAQAVGDSAFAGELRHTQEHSVELASVWLHHLRGGEPVATVPVLTGSFARFMGPGGDPSADPQVGAFLGGLRNILSEKDTLLVAAGDLAHLGPAFSTSPMDDAAKTSLQQADEALITTMCQGDAQGFFNRISAVRDENNVCGFSPIYLTLKALEKTSGASAGYAQCPADEAVTSVVSVCGVVLQ